MQAQKEERREYIAIEIDLSEEGVGALVPVEDDPLSDDAANFELGTFRIPEEDHNAPRVYRLALLGCAIFALGFSLAYFVEDTNGDAYIINELVEYITATTVVSWGTWCVGLVLNGIPNIAESFLLFSLTMLKLLPFYLRPIRRIEQMEHAHEHEHAHDHEHDHHELMVSDSSEPVPHLSLEVEKDADFEVEGHHTQDDEKLLENSPTVPDHDHAHHHHEHTTAETIREVFLMGITPGALGFSASYLVLASAPLWVRILVSLICGGVGGAADWIKHSHFNHAAGHVDPQNPLARTFGTNLWHTDRSIAWKLHETWVKVIIMIHHGGSGLFNWYAVLSVTALADLMPSWASLLIASLLAAPSFYYEGISETYAYDQAQQRPDFQIHRLSKGGLIAGGIIHSLSFVIIVAKLYQGTPEKWGPYYYLLNSAIFSVLSVLLLYPGALGFYVMQKHPPRDHDGVEGVCFDDIIRLLLRAPPRPDRPEVNAELRAQMRFWRAPDLSHRVTILEDDKPEPTAAKVDEQPESVPESRDILDFN